MLRIDLPNILNLNAMKALELIRTIHFLNAFINQHNFTISRSILFETATQTLTFFAQFWHKYTTFTR